VEDELRAMAAEGMLHAATIRHVGDGDFQGTARATRLQLGGDGVQAVLVAIQQHERRRPERPDLAC